jgi:hypothetical protein
MGYQNAGGNMGGQMGGYGQGGMQNFGGNPMMGGGNNFGGGFNRGGMMGGMRGGMNTRGGRGGMGMMNNMGGAMPMGGNMMMGGGMMGGGMNMPMMNGMGASSQKCLLNHVLTIDQEVQDSADNRSSTPASSRTSSSNKAATRTSAPMGPSDHVKSRALRTSRGQRSLPLRLQIPWLSKRRGQYSQEETTGPQKNQNPASSSSLEGGTPTKGWKFGYVPRPDQEREMSLTHSLALRWRFLASSQPPSSSLATEIGDQYVGSSAMPPTGSSLLSALTAFSGVHRHC